MVVLVILVSVLLIYSLDLSESKGKFQRGYKLGRNKELSHLNNEDNRNVHARLFDFDILYYDFKGE